MPGPRSIVRKNYSFAGGTRITDKMIGNKIGTVRRSGKTKADRESGKHARRLVNRHADPIREHGGKQFGSKKG